LLEHTLDLAPKKEEWNQEFDMVQVDLYQLLPLLRGEMQTLIQHSKKRKRRKRRRKKKMIWMIRMMKMMKMMKEMRRMRRMRKKVRDCLYSPPLPSPKRSYLHRHRIEQQNHLNYQNQQLDLDDLDDVDIAAAADGAASHVVKAKLKLMAD
jgi:hypothetical protein